MSVVAAHSQEWKVRVRGAGRDGTWDGGAGVRVRARPGGYCSLSPRDGGREVSSRPFSPVMDLRPMTFGTQEPSPRGRWEPQPGSSCASWVLPSLAWWSAAWQLRAEVQTGTCSHHPTPELLGQGAVMGAVSEGE